MNSFDAILILLFLVSLVYSSVGHGGASGYLAALSLLGMSPEQMRPAALVLNVFVSMIAFVQYYRGGHFRWRLFLPFAILSIPMAFLGSFVKLGPAVYKQILGLFLVVAVLRILGILLFRWGNLKETAAVSALFILVNSLAGLSGLWKQGTSWPPELHWWILVAVGGGIIGSWWGSHRADNIVLRYVLAIVLLLAAIKLIFI
jgi:uncharacterized membrane protein YfcA